MISKVVFEIKNSIRGWSDQNISFSAKNINNVSIIIKDIRCELVVCKFRLIRPHIPLRTDQPFRM